MQLQFKIQLKEISKPPVWRKVLVPDSFTFERFHQVIQAAFEWNNYHLYSFSPQGYGSIPRISISYDSGWDNDPDDYDSQKIKLSKIFQTKGQKFTYIYDFGDDWEHKIILEDIKEGNSKKAQFLSGKGACPPEDCGGAWGYEDLLEILADPEHEEYEETREWLGLEGDEEWDPKYFDVEFAKIMVS